jgi:hypothetical protein
MNLKMLRNRKQADTEPFTEYYTSIIDLCRKHDPAMSDSQIIDWLKAGMQITLYEKLQGEDLLTPQGLLLCAQRVELDNAVLVARKREGSMLPPVDSTPPSIHYNNQKRWDSTSYPQAPPTPLYPSSYPPSLLSIPIPTSNVPSFSKAPGPRTSFHSQSCS